MAGRRVDCVGGIVLDPRGRLLLVLRGQEPAKGTWSVPGGRVEDGETDAEATVREVLEETGLRVVVDRWVGTVERDAPGGAVYVIRDHLCRLEHGVDPAAAQGGDDADQAAWFAPGELDLLHTSPGLVEALTGWGILSCSR